MHLSSIIKPTMEPVHGQQFGRPSVEKCDYSKLLPTIVSFLSNSKESFRKVRNCSDGQAKSTTPAELSVPERAQAPRGRQTELEISVNSIQIYIQSSLFITR